MTATEQPTREVLEHTIRVWIEHGTTAVAPVPTSDAKVRHAVAAGTYAAIADLDPLRQAPADVVGHVVSPDSVAAVPTGMVGVAGAVFWGRVVLPPAPSATYEFRDCVFVGGLELRGEVGELLADNCLFVPATRDTGGPSWATKVGGGLEVPRGPAVEVEEQLAWSDAGGWSRTPPANGARRTGPAEPVGWAPEHQGGGVATVERPVEAAAPHVPAPERTAEGDAVAAPEPVLRVNDRPVFDAGLVEVRRRVTITRSVFGGRVRLRGVVTGSTVDLSGSSVVWPYDTGDSVRASIDVSNSTIGGDLDLSDVSVYDLGINLAGASIAKQLAMAGLQVHVTTAPDRAAVYAPRCAVGESVLIRRSPQRNRSPRFGGCVDFTGARIEGNFQFRGAELNHVEKVTPPPRLYWWQWRRKARFEEARAVVGPETDLDLAQARIGDALELVPLVERPARINLTFVSTTRLVLGAKPHERWQPLAYSIDGLRYATVATREWDDVFAWVKGATDRRATRPLVTLAKAAEAAGQPRTHVAAMINASSRAANPMERALLSWVRYGWRPWLVAVPLFVLGLAVFAQVHHTLRLDHGFAVGVDAAGPPSPVGCDASREQCLVEWKYALDAVVPVDLGQVSRWQPNRDAGAGRVLDDLATASLIASWAFAGVFVAAVAGKLKRTG